MATMAVPTTMTMTMLFTTGVRLLVMPAMFMII